VRKAPGYKPEFLPAFHSAHGFRQSAKGYSLKNNTQTHPGVKPPYSPVFIPAAPENVPAAIENLGKVFQRTGRKRGINPEIHPVG
jgi:hypothetical protein